MELKQYIAPLLKWWWLILATTAVAVASSIYAIGQQPSTYQARASVIIGRAINDPNPDANEFWLAQDLGQTYVDMSQRAPVRQAVMESLGLTWLPEYEVRMVPNTQIIEFLVTDTEPQRAMVVANELANRLILASPTSREQEDRQRQEFIKGQLDLLEGQIETTMADIQIRQSELGDLVSARQIADSEAQLASLQNKLTTLQSNYASLLASTQQGAVNSLDRFENATVPTEPVGPNRLLTILTAAAIGLLIGAGAAYFLEYLDDSVKTPDDVEAAVQLPVLSAIARHKYDRDKGDDLITRASPRSAVAEAYRGLRTAILFSAVDRRTRSILISSSREKEGKSLTAANLAVVLAQANNKVLLVDLDLRRPTQHRIFGSARNIGLTNYLVQLPLEEEEAPAAQQDLDLLQNFVRSTAQEGLFLLSSGPLPPNPSEIVGSAKMGAFCQLVARQYDYVVYDTPPILAVTDAVILATRVDSAILVADTGKTRRAELRRAVERLQEVGAHIDGIVLNRLSRKSGNYYYYYGYESKTYHDDPGASNGKRRKKASLPPSDQPVPGLSTQMRGTES